ncbi:MAG: hypothetical protein LBI10_09550 [Deltaproteobacteria bacterium]|jgi:hypothetical protein|nr:hypothetical protein [Deltaproteobacteria bacterium]
MKTAGVKAVKTVKPPPLLSKEVFGEDWVAFNRLTSIELTAKEASVAVHPSLVDPTEKRVLAVHWHPEWIPIELVAERVKRAFPAALDSLVIPTQHNQILTYGEWSGVEADAYAPDYGLKIQLLIHLRTQTLPKATTLVGMMERTFRYRALQLLDILDNVVNPDATVKNEIKKLGFSSDSINLAQLLARRLQNLIEKADLGHSNRAETLKNRLLPDFMAARGQEYPPETLDRAMALCRLVKSQVKRRLTPSRFHTAKDLVEEAKGLGAGVVIPHPPQFWPILLSDLNVDGWEVWNPSTPNHTIFLLEALARQKKNKRPILAFMGDDTHMSSKIRPDQKSEEKNNLDREIGFQSPWRDPKVLTVLKKTGQSRERTMDEYRTRLT